MTAQNRLNGRKPTALIPIWAARCGWLLILGLVATLFIFNLPGLVIRNQFQWQVDESWPVWRELFASRTAFGRWLTIWHLVSGAVFMGTALLLAWRKWADRVVLLISAALLMLAPIVGLSFDIGNTRFPSLVTRFIPDINGVTVLLMVGALLTLFTFFPDGQVQPRRFRWLTMVVNLHALLWSSVFAFPAVARRLETFWPAYNGEDGIGWALFGGSLLLALLVGLAGQVIRYARISSAEQRQQTKWALLGLCAFLTIPIGTFVLFDLANLSQTPLSHFVTLHLQPLTTLMIPVTIAFSVLRYRLWEVDLWLNRTLVYGLLTAVIVLSYVLIVGGLGLLLRGDSIWLAIITTGLVALAIQPLREWLQRGVNRLLYGEQADPVQLLSRLGTRLEAAADADALLPTLVEGVATALKLPYVAVQINGTETPVAAYGIPGGISETWPLLYQGVAIGRLQVARRGPTEPFSRRERRLLETIAHQAGAAAQAVQLTADLRRSRQRIVIAREEERRRLRRDLHDGLGPQLATLTLQIDAVRNLLRSEPEAAEEILRDLKAGTQNGLAEIRRVVHELRPAALDQLGLIPAIRQHGVGVEQGGLTVAIEAADPLPSQPAAVEVAAYRIVVEAVTNAARHAQATNCTVRLWAVDDLLHLEISDDGRGLPDDYQPGVGITSMRERAAEVGGTFAISSAAGVQIKAALPTGKEAV